MMDEGIILDIIIFRLSQAGCRDKILRLPELLSPNIVMLDLHRRHLRVSAVSLNQ